MTGVAGQEFIFKCECDQENSSVIWSKSVDSGVPSIIVSNRKLTRFGNLAGKFQPSNEDLLLKKAACSNSGIYECHCTNNNNNNNKIFNLEVKVRISKSRTVLPGSSAMISCATGEYDLINWYFRPSLGEDPVKIGDNRVEYQQLEVHGGDKRVLIINDFQSNDTGLYTCASASRNVTSAWAHLAAAKENGGDAEKIRIGQDYPLNCTVEPTNENEVIFCAAGKSQECCVLYSNRTLNPKCNSHVVEDVQDGKHRLLLRNFSDSDAGQYSCTDEGGFGVPEAMTILVKGFMLFYTR